MKPRYTSAAEQDLAAIAAYIARDKPGAALVWIDRIEAMCLSIGDSPMIGDLQPHLGAGVRGTAFGRYVIYHRETSGEVEILRIIPADRDVRHL
jgi:plasmid stabilization system protein ParE